MASESIHKIDFLTEDIIIRPTRINTGAVAAPGTAKKNGARNNDRRKHTAVTKEVSPLRPPSPTPEALSTKVVMVLVPSMAPAVVPMASTKRLASGEESFHLLSPFRPL